MVLASRDNLSMRIIKMCVHAVVGGIILAHSAGTYGSADYTTICRDGDTFCITRIRIL